MTNALTKETSFLEKLGAPRRAKEALLLAKEELRERAVRHIARMHARGNAVDLAPYRQLFDRRELGVLINRNENIRLGPEQG